jgi:hypothetical protein
MFSLRKEGINSEFWEMDVSFCHHTTFLYLNIFYRVRHVMCVRGHPPISDDSQSMRRYFTEVSWAILRLLALLRCCIVSYYFFQPSE